jgi:hypothetical protein
LCHDLRISIYDGPEQGGDRASRINYVAHRPCGSGSAARFRDPAKLLLDFSPDERLIDFFNRIRHKLPSPPVYTLAIRG